MTQLPDGPAPGDLEAEAVARVAVRRALGSLTNSQRALIVLRVFDDLTEAQTAQVLGCALGTVKEHDVAGPHQVARRPRPSRAAGTGEAMSELDERNLRDMLEQAAGEPPRWVSLDSIRRRAIQRRVTQVGVTSLAVAAVGIGATFSAYAAHSGQATGGAKVPAGPPRYYLQHEFSGKNLGIQAIAVRARATGKVTSVVRDPLPKYRCGDELAAAGRHTFSRPA